MNLQPRLGAALVLVLIAACSSFGGTSDATTPAAGDDGGTSDGSGPPPVQGGAPIVLTLQAPALIQTGMSADVEVSVVRDGPMAFAGDVHLALRDLPDVTASAVDIPPDHQTATMTISVSPNRKNGQTPFVILATSGDSMASATFSALVRGPIGSLDTSFGTDGFFSLQEDSEAAGLWQDTSGKLFVAGRLGSDIGFVALTDEGIIDTTYATNGVVRSSVGTLASTYYVSPSPPSVLFYSNILNSGVPSTILAKLTMTGLDNTFGVNGIATIAGLQSASAVGSTAPGVAPAGTLIAGRPDTTKASSRVMLINADGTPNPDWPVAGQMAVTSDCDGASNSQCGPRAMAPRPMTSFVYQCVNKLLSAELLVTDVTNDSNSSVTLTGSCSDMVRTTQSNYYIAGNAPNAQVIHVNGVTIDTAFDGQAPSASNMANAKRIIAQGDGATFLLAVEAVNAGHIAMGVWRIDSAGKTDLAFNPPNGYTIAPIAGTDISVSSMVLDSQGRILVAGGNGHMVVARFWQ